MAKTNYDGVLEAAHYKPDGQLEWVRVYERLGAIFSDRIILSREAFIKQLKAKKRYVVGERILNYGGKFNVSRPVYLDEQAGKPFIVVGSDHAAQDDLEGVPSV